jgi:hypothetical protein
MILIPISSYAAEQYGHVFKYPSTTIRTVTAERTFWEKVTILHREANRPIDKKFPARYSRHYYDLWCMSKTAICERAYRDIPLLETVVRFKSKFYRDKWARYEEAKPPSMKLLPPPDILEGLGEDYKHMENMIFGDKSNFHEIIESLRLMEKTINRVL